MSRRKKAVETPVIENPEIIEELTTLVEEAIKEQTVPAEPPVKEDVPSPKLEAAPKEEMKKPSFVATPESPYSPALEVRKIIKEMMTDAPKRNDSTTMPSPVTLKSSTGNVYFLMYHFDAITVESLWLKVKHLVSPDEFVIYLYTTMGLTPPKLYLYRKDLVIA